MRVDKQVTIHLEYENGLGMMMISHGLLQVQNAEKESYTSPISTVGGRLVIIMWE